MKTFIGGIGCFWDETKYEGISGIISTECGYCGGDDPNVTYKAVCGGDTGHIEVVKVEYDENFDNCQEEEDSWVSSVLGTEDDAIYDVLSEIQ